MKKIIDGKKYNTETAKAINYYINNCPTNDFRYYVETLYQKRTGEFFLHGEGGGMSPYAERCSDGSYCWGESIIPLTKVQAKAWAEKRLDVDEYEEMFGEVEE